MFQECWAASDSGKAYAQALAARGYTLALGDRRAYVAIDFRGQTYAAAKWTGIKAKNARDRLDTLKDLPGVEQAKAAIAARMTDTLRGHIAEAETDRQKLAATLAMQRTQTVEKQRKERTDLATAQEKRWAQETIQRASRLNKGIRGLWDRLTGRYSKQAKENEREALSGLHRDQQEKDALIERHLQEREGFHMLARQQKQGHEQNMEELHRDIAEYMGMNPTVRTDAHDHSHGATQRQERLRKIRGSSKAQESERGPSR